MTVSGAADQVEAQKASFVDPRTIDLDVVLTAPRLLIKNKISAYWSHVDGVAQPERYVRSRAGYVATMVLLAFADAAIGNWDARAAGVPASGD